MQNTPRLRYFQKNIWKWFAVNRRALPWRKTHDPYRITVSEIMLQQTQVARVIPKFEHFVHRFPTWESLARAPLSDVLRSWSGLGYNRRARQLRELAQELVRRHGSTLPEEEKKLTELPGIGVYTARAIRAFAFRKRAAPQDTNIQRIMRRFFFGERAVPSKDIAAQTEASLPHLRYVLWNHALMDFGALVCTAQKPGCAACPLRTRCKAAPHFLGGAKPAVRKSPPKEQFTASQRYIRGQTIKLLLARGMPEQELITLLQKTTNQPRSRVRQAIHALIAERLVTRSRYMVRLA